MAIFNDRHLFFFEWSAYKKRSVAGVLFDDPGRNIDKALVNGI